MTNNFKWVEWFVSIVDDYKDHCAVYENEIIHPSFNLHIDRANYIIRLDISPNYFTSDININTTLVFKDSTDFCMLESLHSKLFAEQQIALQEKFKQLVTRGRGKL